MAQENFFYKKTHENINAAIEARKASALTIHPHRYFPWARVTSQVDVRNHNDWRRKYVLWMGAPGFNQQKINSDNAIHGMPGDFNDTYRRNTNQVSNSPFDEETTNHPMPGLTSITVDSKGALGASKKCSFKFKCWTLEQLNIMEHLYMILGKTVCVEWGWNIYPTDATGTNYGKVVPNEKLVTPGYKGRSGQTPSLHEAAIETWDKEKEYFGHYSSVTGKITTFKWNMQDDISFDCEVEIVSLGDSYLHMSNKPTNQNQTRVKQIQDNEGKQRHQFLRVLNPDKRTVTDNFQGFLELVKYEYVPTIEIKGQMFAGDSTITLRPMKPPTREKFSTNMNVLRLAPVGLFGSGLRGDQEEYCYIKFEELLRRYNEALGIQRQNDKVINRPGTINYAIKMDVDSPIWVPFWPGQISADPSTVILPGRMHPGKSTNGLMLGNKHLDHNETWSYYNTFITGIDKSIEKLEALIDDTTIRPEKIRNWPKPKSINDLFKKTTGSTRLQKQLPVGIVYDDLRKVLVNIAVVSEIHENAETILDFWKNLLDAISQACGGRWTFSVEDEISNYGTLLDGPNGSRVKQEKSSLIRIFETTEPDGGPGEPPDPTLGENDILFDLYGASNILRKVSLSTDLTSKVANTVILQSSNPEGESYDNNSRVNYQYSFYAYGVKDLTGDDMGYIPKSLTQMEADTADQGKDEEVNIVEEFAEALKEWESLNGSARNTIAAMNMYIDSFPYIHEAGIEADECSVMKVKQLKDNAIANNKLPMINSNPVILPLKLSITLDGLAGLKPGNMFYVNGLPARYYSQGTEYADKFSTKFVVTNVKHEITANDWTTTLKTAFRPKILKRQVNKS